MSESAQIIVRLDPLDAQARERLVADLLAWLVEIEVIATWPPLDGSNVPGTTSWAPGRAWRSVVEEPDIDLLRLRHNGVEATAVVGIQSAYGNSENPLCARCGTEFPLLESWDLIDAWEAGMEPVVTCQRCGWSALLGDWPAEFPPALVGAPALTFNGWPGLRRAFVDEIVERMGGGRCRFFHQHL